MPLSVLQNLAIVADDPVPACHTIGAGAIPRAGRIRQPLAKG